MPVAAAAAAAAVAAVLTASRFRFARRDPRFCVILGIVQTLFVSVVDTCTCSMYTRKNRINKSSCVCRKMTTQCSSTSIYREYKYSLVPGTGTILF